MKILLITALLTLYIAIFANASFRDEPQCYSRFDYEFKVVQKLFMLENAYNEQLEINKALRTEINSMKQTGQDMKAVLQDTNNRNKALASTVESMKNVSAGNRGNCLILFLIHFIFIIFLLLSFFVCFFFFHQSSIYSIYRATVFSSSSSFY